MKKLSELSSPALAGVVREKTEKAAIAEIKNCLCGGADMIDLHMSCLENADETTLRNIISASKLPILALNYNTTYDWCDAGYSEEQRAELFLKSVDCGAAGIDMQGYDAENPINRYAANLADALSAEEINKAIGGEIFRPWLADLKDDIEPDYIAVAYGTNHWHFSSSEEFRSLCEEFYDKIVANYPKAKVFALTPIWRKDRTDFTRFKSFEEIGEIIVDVVKKYDNVTCISGRYLIPEDETLFSDLYLHPNDKGFKYYSEGVKKAIGE